MLPINILELATTLNSVKFKGWSWNYYRNTAQMSYWCYPCDIVLITSMLAGCILSERMHFPTGREIINSVQNEKVHWSLWPLKLKSALSFSLHMLGYLCFLIIFTCFHLEIVWMVFKHIFGDLWLHSWTSHHREISNIYTSIANKDHG